MKITLTLLAIAMVVCAFTILGGGDPKKGAAYFEAQANCIAEYDYQHPGVSVMDNLTAALEQCR